MSLPEQLGNAHQDEQAVIKPLQKQIRKALSGKGQIVAKEDHISGYLKEALCLLGRFYRESDGTVWFFRHQNHKLYEVRCHQESGFGKYLTFVADQSVNAQLMSRSLDRLQAAMLETAEVVEVHGIAYNSDSLDVIAFNDFGGGMWRRNREGQWEWKPNGSEGILFWTPGDLVQAWAPEFTTDHAMRDEDHLQWFIDQPHFSEQGLTIGDQRLILRALLLAPFFPSLNHTRPVQAHLGLSHDQQHDTGKTMAGKMIGIFWMGASFAPTPVDSTDKGKEALHLLLGQTPFVLLDNADTQTPWLNDFLCTYATGQRMARRKLYSDNTMLYYVPKARLCVTSRKASFNREDTATRVIPFRFAPIGDAERKTEPELLDPVLARRGKIWAGILQTSAQLQDRLLSMLPPSPTARMADFDAFGWRVGSIYGDADAWQGAMARLKVAQANFSLEDNPLVPILKDWLNEGDIPEMPTSEFFEEIKTKAQDHEISWGLPHSAASCTAQIKKQRTLLESELGVQISFRTLRGTTLVQIVRGPTWSDSTDGVTGVTGDPLCCEKGE